jgi:hypothetical protein
MRSARSSPEAVILAVLNIINFVVLFLALLAPAWAFGERQTPPPPAQNVTATAAELKVTLARAAEYCDRLSHSVLNYVCRERIKENDYPNATATSSFGRRTIWLGREEIHEYAYEYQLIRDAAGAIRETRTLINDNGKRVHLADASLETHIISYAYIVMGPIGLLSRERQALHDYRMVRGERVAGEETIVIEAVPKPETRLGHLFGTIWLRKKDNAIVKIEWNPSSMENYAAVEEIAKRLKMVPDLLMTSEYAFEKNGVRFPSRYTIKEIYRRGKSGRRFQRSVTEVVYDQYKFFTVETEVKF